MEDRTLTNRTSFVLKVAAASALLLYAFHSSYGLILPVDRGEDTMRIAAWLIVFEGMSWVARSKVKRPVAFRGSRWPLSFFLTGLISSLLLPFGSLFVRVLLPLAPILGGPSTEVVKAGIDMIWIDIPLTAYIHYTILAYEDRDTRSWQQRVKPAIDYFRKNEIRLVYLVVSVIFLYHFYFFTHEVNGSPDMRRLLRIDMPRHLSDKSEGVPFAVGRKGYPLIIEGTFASGRTYNIQNPIFGTRYRSSDPSVATVSKAGVIAGVAPGRTVIRAENRGHTAELPVRVYVPMEGGIALRADAGETALPGSEVTLYATIEHDNLEKMEVLVHWTSKWETATLSRDVFVYRLKMPDDYVGEANFEASARFDDGDEYATYTSNTVSLLVIPDLSKLVGLKFSPEGPAVSTAYRSITRQVIGVFADGSEFSLSAPRLGTAISVKDPSLAEVKPFVSGTVPAYSISCRSIGETEIVATNNGFSTSVPLVIRP